VYHEKSVIVKKVYAIRFFPDRSDLASSEQNDDGDTRGVLVKITRTPLVPTSALQSPSLSPLHIISDVPRPFSMYLFLVFLNPAERSEWQGETLTMRFIVKVSPCHSDSQEGESL
jgi:hypothetical protein